MEWTKAQSPILMNKVKILTFQWEMSDMGMEKATKILKLGDDVQSDKAVFLWIKQNRMEGVPITGPLLCVLHVEHAASTITSTYRERHSGKMY